MDQDLIAYLDRRFAALDQGVEQQVRTLREETAQGLDKVGQQVQTLREENTQRFDRVDQRFDRVDQRLEALETDVRGAYVAIEDLRDDVRLVAEGVVNVTEQISQKHAEVSQRISDLESLLRQSYQDLDTRVRKL